MNVSSNGAGWCYFLLMQYYVSCFVSYKFSTILMQYGIPIDKQVEIVFTVQISIVKCDFPFLRLPGSSVLSKQNVSYTLGCETL